MTGLGIVIPRAATGPIVDPVHSAGVAGASHRWITGEEDYADGEMFATLHDLIGSANLVNTVATLTAREESQTTLARLAPGNDVTRLANTTVDLGDVFSFCLVARIPSVNVNIGVFDGLVLTRLTNGGYRLAGAGSLDTGSGQTGGWAVLMGGVGAGFTGEFFTVNNVTAAGDITAFGSQTNRVNLGPGSGGTQTRTDPHDYAELITWPFLLTTQQRADALAAMRAAYPFVPQA